MPKVRGTIFTSDFRVNLPSGDDHHRQKKIMEPAFGPAQLRSFFPIFRSKATKVGISAIYLHAKVSQNHSLHPG